MNKSVFYAIKLIRKVLDLVPDNSLLICDMIPEVALKDGNLLHIQQFRYDGAIDDIYVNTIGDVAFLLTPECKEYLRQELTEDKYDNIYYFCHWCVAHDNRVLICVFDNYYGSICKSLGISSDFIAECKTNSKLYFDFEDEITL